MVRRLLNIGSRLKQHNSLFLLGPRGVGKTWLVKDYLTSTHDFLAYDLLKGELYRKFVNSTEVFRKEIEYQLTRVGKLCVFVDEVQRIPSLLNEVHHLIEEYQQRVQFILTGSSARKLRRGEGNLLAGRARTLKLHPLTFMEEDKPLERAAQFGQLPTVSKKPDSSYLESYVDTYLREEIYQESLIRKQEVFTRFLDVAAQFSGELINFSRVGKLSGTSDKTVREYFQILVDTLLVHRIEGWCHSSIKQLNQQPRFYFFDTGILNAIRGETLSQVRLSSSRGGKLFEHLVVLELIKLNDYYNKRYRFFHYRTRQNQEIDLILQRTFSDPPIAVEIKVDGEPSKSELLALINLKKELPETRCYCLTAGTSLYQQDGITITPWRKGVQEIMGVTA